MDRSAPSPEPGVTADLLPDLGYKGVSANPDPGQRLPAAAPSGSASNAAAPSADPFPAYLVTVDGDSIHHGATTLCPTDLDGGEVVVTVAWSSVNYKDGMVTVPGNRVARRSPLVPGVDLAGTVVASTEPSIAVGTDVVAHGHGLGVSHHGGFAAMARVPATWVVPLPAGLSARSAMVIGTAGFTAAASIDLLERHGLEPSAGPVLVTGATGGVGSMAVAMLARRGYEVVASTGKPSAGSWLAGLGAARVIGRDELDEAPGRTLGPQRWAGAVDCVGGTTLALVLRQLRYGAAVAASGLTAGSALDTTVYPFITRGVGLLGVDSVDTPTGRRTEVWARIADPGDLRPADLERFIDREVSLAELPSALADILAARVRGRILVDPARA